jgi:hypothetical protein
VTELDRHWPRRPSWDCLRCARPWPCDPARESLAHDDANTRNIYLSIQMEQATEDMPTAPADDLYERFLGWTRSATR